MNLGFQFHTHGETWLGLISRQKEWFLYPPGFHIPLSQQRNWNSFISYQNLTSQEYLATILCEQNQQKDISNCFNQLKSIPKSFYSLNSSKTKEDEANNKGFYSHLSDQYKPLHCTQRAGDILYLPSGWSHMTYNSPSDINGYEENSLPNVVIGIGAQSIWDTSEREQECYEILSFTQPISDINQSNSFFQANFNAEVDITNNHNFLDYECLKSLGNINKQKASEIKQILLNKQDDITKLNQYVNQRCNYLYNAVVLYRYGL